jgi:predicted nucleotidyltransferase component of viral defense system
MENTIISSLLEQYDCKSIQEYRNALKEIVQSLVLIGLTRSDFFEKAAFYGGTALRKFYDLQRFSEDLDFSLIAPDKEFSLNPYIDSIKDILRSYGFEMNVEIRDKVINSPIKSAFVKGNTLTQLISFTAMQAPIRGVPGNESIKVKFEIDTDPPLGAVYEVKTQLQPELYQVRLYDLSSQAAGKICAVLTRSWGNRVKGRDYYDYIWFLQKNIKVNYFHLQQRLLQQDPHSTFTEQSIIEMLCRRFASIDFKKVRDDILPFIKKEEVRKLDYWNEAAFTDATKQYLKFV